MGSAVGSTAAAQAMRERLGRGSVPGAVLGAGVGAGLGARVAVQAFDAPLLSRRVLVTSLSGAFAGSVVGFRFGPNVGMPGRTLRGLVAPVVSGNGTGVHAVVRF